MPRDSLDRHSDARFRPLLIDLFCCQGGAGMGYYRAGFDVIGVDIKPQPQYPFTLSTQDALEFLRKRVEGMFASGPWWGTRPIAAVHASPPCQGYLNLTKANEAMGRSNDHMTLIEETRVLLAKLGVPYVIENVADAAKEMAYPVRVCGTAFGLPIRRHRLFESNVPLVGTPCEHHRFTEKKYWTGWRPKGEHRLSTVVQVYGNAADKHEWPAAMGIDWMTNDGMAEAVPPAYTEHIGAQLLAALEVRDAA